jgi:Ferritin-like
METIDRWRTTILGVAGQEMLHLALTANMLTALGASPHLSRPNLPQPARHYPPGVRLALLPFGEQALRHFMFLERPEGMELEDAAGLDAVADATPLMTQDEIVPRLQDFATVGHLYRSIEAASAISSTSSVRSACSSAPRGPRSRRRTSPGLSSSR